MIKTALKGQVATLKRHIPLSIKKPIKDIALSFAKGTKPPTARKIIREAGALWQASRLDDALAKVEEALKIQPDHTRALNLKARILLTQARALRKAWRLDDALNKINEALTAQPNNTKALCLKADILINLGSPDHAVLCCNAVLELSPFDLGAISLLKSVGKKVKFTKEGVLEFLATHDRPEYRLAAAAYLNEDGYFSEVIDITASAGPATPVIRSKLFLERGRAFELLGRYIEAVAAYRQVDKTISAKLAWEATSGIARCELEAGNAEAALRALDGIAIGKHHIPALYAVGDIRTAHLSYRSRASSHSIAHCFGLPPPETINIKSGCYSSKEALILVEAGPGDEIRFASMYNELAAWFRDLTITCDPRLHSLLVRSFPNIRFMPVPRYRKEFPPAGGLSDRMGLPDVSLTPFMNDEALAYARTCGFVCSILDTLGEFRAERSDFRNSPSQLIPDPSLVQFFKGQGDRMRIGIAWRSILLSTTRNLHYLQVEDLQPLAGIKDAEFWVLQAGISEQELQTLKSILPNVKVPNIDLRDDFEGQAALMSTMDCVISPLTTTAELAGMIGVRTYLLSATHTTTWRRNLDGTDIWYENGRLVHGNPVHDRRSLMENVVAQILGKQLPIERGLALSA